MSTPSLLSINGVTKRFPGVLALEGVSLRLEAGEVLSIIGENGAGKSTLMKILGGVYIADAGTVAIEGKEVSIKTPADALAQGVRVIYQELSVLENLTVAANVFLGREPKKGPFLNEGKMVEDTRAILARLGSNIDPSTLVGRLSLAERQLVEIARALSMNVKILVLDEPTSSLTVEETEQLLNLIRDLRKDGVGILYISHRLDEVKEISDRVVGLRDGRNAGGLSKEEISHEAMVRLMVGRDIKRERVAHTIPADAPTMLSVAGAATVRFPESVVDLEIKAGEIVGVAGLVGSGRSELARALFGIDRFATEPNILVDGKKVKLRSSQDAIEAGIYLVPEDRRGAGITVAFSVKQNVSMPSLKELRKGFSVDGEKEAAYAQEAVEKLGVKTATIETKVGTLSGGNQQKVVIGRWLMKGPKVLIFDEPTRGIDVGAKAEIYSQMRKLTDEGIAILMISSDMEEVLAMSDRVAVMREGQIMGILEGNSATEEQVMTLAVGGQL